MSATPRILLIDDDVKLTRLLCAYLAAQGLDVTPVHDGAEGLERASRGGWDLVILDGMLPRLDGMEVLRQLRRTSRVPVIMLTARSLEDHRVAGLEEGADDYLPKSVSPRELTARIRAVLRRLQPEAPTASSPTLQVGDLNLDLAAHTALLSGRSLALTPAEYGILRLLASKPGRVFTREELGRALGEDAFDPHNRTLDVHVTALRRKLGDDPREPRYLGTVRGTGYFMVKP